MYAFQNISILTHLSIKLHHWLLVIEIKQAAYFQSFIFQNKLYWEPQKNCLNSAN